MNIIERWKIPFNWKWVQISELGKIVAGGTPSTKEASYWGDEVNWITPADLSGYNDKFITKGSKSLSKKGLENSSAQLMPSGSIHFSSRAPIGYVVISKEEITTNQGFKSLVPEKKIFNEYVYYYLKSAKQLAEESASGTTFKEISKKSFSLLPIPIAPYNEQTAIVSKIEQLFSDLDNGIDNFKKAQEQLKTYRKVILKNACLGKLVPTEAELARMEGREYEPANILLLNILEGRCKKWKGKGKYNMPISPDKSKLPEIPEGWCWTIISEIISETQIGLVRSTSVQNTENSNVPYIKMNNITMDGKVLLNDLVKVQGTDEELVRYGIKEGDILFNTRNSIELVGKTGIIRGDVKGIVYNNNIMRIRTVNDVSSQFVVYQMCSPDFRNRMEMIKKSTTNVAAIYAKDLINLSFLLPPLAEQHRIVSEIEHRLSICDRIEETLTESIYKAEYLRQSILKKAFEGKLLNEKELEEARKAPAWEPAEKLLERIKVEKTNMKSKNNGEK